MMSHFQQAIYVFMFCRLFSFPFFLWAKLADNQGCQLRKFSDPNDGKGQIVWSSEGQKNFNISVFTFLCNAYSATFVYIYLVWQLIVVLSIEANINGIISLPQDSSVFSDH